MLVPQEILVATGNKNKLRQFLYLAKSYEFELLSPAECAERKGIEPIGEVEETADSFLGNARLKAEAYAAWSGMATIADDSGLEVDALDGRPGIYSARYGGPDLSYPERIALIHKEVAESESDSRVARYRCALSFYSEGERVEVEKALEGVLFPGAQGEKGFGYDPLFFLPEYQKTLAELDFEQTCEISHRGLAAKELYSNLRQAS